MDLFCGTASAAPFFCWEKRKAGDEKDKPVDEKFTLLYNINKFIEYICVP